MAPSRSSRPGPGARGTAAGSSCGRLGGWCSMSDAPTPIDAMLDELYGRVGEIAPQPRLSATRRALELLGDPQRAYPIVHITGTNGKTSTSRIIESILRAHGLRTGLFTSLDLGVIEVGMGGEWDSTNVADGQVAVFTPIDLDHTEQLGRTIAAIARTKSGIIKPGRSVVSARQQPEALAELQRAADLTESSMTVEDEGFRVLG